MHNAPGCSVVRWPMVGRRAQTIAIGAGILLAGLVFTVGPWPVRTSPGGESSRYMRRNLAAIRESSTLLEADGTSEAYLAGWATAALVPPAGTPLAGYGDRRGQPSTGTRDQLQVSAIAFGLAGAPGQPAQVVIVGADLLVVTRNAAARVRDVLRQRGTSVPILFSASHTHSGPGAAMRGLVARAFGGPYDREVERVIVESIVDAVTRSMERMQPVRIATGSVAVTDLIRNRTRDSSPEVSLVDPGLDVVTVTGRNGRRCMLVRYSAHATVLGPDNMMFSAGYPGALREAIEDRLGGTAIFLAGAVGSMGPRPPEHEDSYQRARLLGEALALRVEQDLTERPIAGRTLGVSDVEINAPPIQLRLTRRLRLSPVLLRLNGIDRSARMTAVSIGDVVFVGFPGDISGELSMSLRAWGSDRGLSVIPVSFSGDYLGYISPDEYYGELRDNGGLAYETGLMSWTGPTQEQFFLTMAREMIAAATAR